MKHQLERGLIFDQWWFPTNAFGLARLSDKKWSALADMGFEEIRLTFHGTKDTHDRLAGRKGTYRDLIKTIQKAEEFGIEWFAGMMLNTENASLYEETKTAVNTMDTPCSKFGWMLPQSQGRAKDSNRVTMRDIEHLMENTRGWKTEKQLIQEILESPDLAARKTHNHFCGFVYLDIDEDLNVFYGGG